MLHHPVMLAKQLATIDVLSGGRFVAGLGVGGRDQDYQSGRRSARQAPQPARAKRRNHAQRLAR